MPWAEGGVERVQRQPSRCRPRRHLFDLHAFQSVEREVVPEASDIDWVRFEGDDAAGYADECSKQEAVKADIGASVDDHVAVFEDPLAEPRLAHFIVAAVLEV